jgi:hypothetical protein
MASIAHDFLPAEATIPSDRQRLFILFFTGTLIDLVILGLFAEFSSHVFVDAFSTAHSDPTMISRVGPTLS